MKKPEPFLKRYEMLSEDKKKVVDDSGHDILISASAGTGKSHMLVTRLLNRILNRDLEIDEVVVMTFSKAAATELQVKMMNELTACRDAADDDETRDYLNRQIAKLPSAAICTIHSFSLDIVKKYGYVIDFDPASAGNVMDDADKALFDRLAMEEALRHPEEFKDLLEQVSVKPLDFSNLEKAIRNLADKKYNYEDFDKWKEDVFADFTDFEKGKVPQRIKDEIRRQCGHIIRQSKSYIPKLRELYDAGYQMPAKVSKATKLPGPYLDDFDKKFNKVLSQIDDLSLEEIFAATYKPEGNFPTLKFDDNDEKKIFEKLKAGAVLASKTIAGYAEDMNDLVAVCKRTIKYLKTLFMLTEKYVEEFELLKKKAGLIAFDDMSRLAIRILEKDEGVKKQFHERYKEIMVDEYQDSSYEQEDLVKLISKGNNVFRVGDIKQSIYSFRNAKPDLMRGMIRDIDPEKTILLHMKTNYRSVKNILDFTNHLFTHIFNVRDDTVYDPADEDLEVDPDNKEVNDEIRLIKVTTDEELTLNEKRRQLAEWTANEIKDRAEKQGCSYGEFKILVRKNVYKGLMFDIFNRLGVPAYASFNKGFFGDEAVSSVVSLLKLMINRDDRKALVDVLRGPIFNYSDDQIANYFYDDRHKMDVPEERDLKKKVYDLLDSLDECKDIYEIMLRIYGYGNWYLNSISIRQRDNLDAFFEEVSGFAKDNSGIVNLLEYIDKQKDVDRSEATSASAQDDVVQIMSFHQSKGLDGKYVYLLDFSDGASSEKDPIVIDEKLGISLHYVNGKYGARFKNPLRDMIVDRRDQDEFDEEMRLLYVAITRARRQLSVVYFDEKKAGTFCYEELSRLNYISIIKSVLEFYPDPKILSIIDEKEATPLRTERKAVASAAKTIRTYEHKEGEEPERKAAPQIAHEHDNSFIYPLDYAKPAGAERGTIMHRAIELLGIRNISEEDIDGLGLEISPDDRRKIMRFYDDPFTRKLFALENHHEYPYIAIIDDQPRNGTIDLLSIGEEVYVIDFKSDKGVTEEDLIERYTLQLSRYCDIVRRGYVGKKIEALIYSFDLGSYVKIPVEEEQI